MLLPIPHQTKQTLLTIVIQIYNNQHALNLQNECWEEWGSIPNLEVIFLDDGSNPPLDLATTPNWVRKIRIIDDIHWNQPGAKNLAVKLSLSPWILFLDADQFMGKEKILQLTTQLSHLDIHSLYRFRRYCSKTNRQLVTHQNCQLIARDTYENFGGYDEDFAGNYGHEDAYFERLWKFKGGKIIILDEPLLIDQSDLETKGLSRNGRVNELLRRRKMRYWHLKQNVIGNFILKSHFILDFLIKTKIIADGRPTKQIRFNWKEI
jgi:hypothetical protein